MELHKQREKTPQYRTLQRIQKNYIVRCGEPLENIIPGTGTKPASVIRRVEGEIRRLRVDLGQICEEELLGQAAGATSLQKKNQQQELANQKEALLEQVKQLEQQLVQLAAL